MHSHHISLSNTQRTEQVAVVSLGQLALESFVAGASLLVGLFFYDAISVFKSDAMMTVATKVGVRVPSCAQLPAADPKPPPTAANTSGRRHVRSPLVLG